MRARHFLLCVSAGVLIAAGAGLAFSHWSRPYRATVQLLVNDRAFSDPSKARDFLAVMSAPDSLATLSGKIQGGLSLAEIEASSELRAGDGGTILKLSAKSPEPGRAVQLANALGVRVVECYDELGAKRRLEMEGQILASQVRLKEINRQLSVVRPGAVQSGARPVDQAVLEDSARIDSEIRAARTQLRSLQVEETNLLALVARANPSVRSLEEALNVALSRYTEEHPKVKELRAALVPLQKQAAESADRLTESPAGLKLVEVRARRTVLQGQLTELERQQEAARAALKKLAGNEADYTRLQSEFDLLSRRRDELLAAKIQAAGSIQFWKPADASHLTRPLEWSRLLGIVSLASVFGAFAGTLVGRVTLRRRRVDNEATLGAATNLPLLPRLEDLQRLSPAEREYWSTATLAAVEKLSGNPRGGTLVCGVTSSTSGEGRSTWMNLLAEAGGRRGNRVLIITRPESAPAAQPVADREPGRSITPVGSPQLFVAKAEPRAATETDQAILRLSFAPNASHPAFRRTWEHALDAWRNEENALILVELPPASTAEGLLLASSMPNVLWISGMGIADVALTRKCLMNLRNMNTQLIAAALNSCPAPRRKSGLQKWFAALFTWLAAVTVVVAAEQSAAPNGLSATKAPAIAPWQEKLTLGAGDTFDISLYGQPDSLRQGMAVGPDGRVSYLQATDILAAGLTVDELRARIEAALSKFHLAPRVVIIPTAYNSKKYFILGNVNQRGAYQLDRPVTIVEAIAKAQGFLTTPQQRNSLMLADLPHAFLMRRQANGEFKREPVDFEALFLNGDLKQNKLLAPEDYLYFPPLGLQEVYVLGEVRTPGSVAFTRDITTIAAIAGRGGFKEKAYRSKVLVVRGSLQNPKTFVIDTASILGANSPDFALQPRDIVYVARRPWARAEELLELAASDFLRAVIVSYTGNYVGPRISY